MAGVLLALFPVLLMFDTRLALADIVVAIVVLYTKRTRAARRSARPEPSTDHFI